MQAVSVPGSGGSWISASIERGLIEASNWGLGAAYFGVTGSDYGVDGYVNLGSSGVRTLGS